MSRIVSVAFPTWFPHVIMRTIFITAIIIRYVRHPHPKLPGHVPHYHLYGLLLRSLHRRIPCQRLRSCRAACVQSGGCEVTEAACIYRLSEQRNVLLTVEAIFRAFLLMARSIVEERRWFSRELLTRLPHISFYPHSVHGRPTPHIYPSSHIASCFTPSTLFFPNLPTPRFTSSPPLILPISIYLQSYFIHVHFYPLSFPPVYLL